MRELRTIWIRMTGALRLAGVFAVATLLAAPAVFAQGFIPSQQPPWVFAADYGRWALPGQAANTFTFAPGSVCNATQIGYKNAPFFNVFSSTVGYAPVLVQDINQTNSEVLTPSTTFTQTQYTCGVNLSPVNTHKTFTLQSGTGGLQEALNQVAVSTSPYITTVLLTAEWYKAVANITAQVSSVTPTSILAAAKGSSTAQIVDITQTPWATYQWNGTAYAAAFGSTGGTVAPTPVLGAAAGTSPTGLAISGTGSSGFVSFTAGTGTTTGTIFTLTWPTTKSYTYQPNCTITSVGANQYVTGTLAVTYSASHAVLTYSEATAVLTASTAYQFRYNCN